MKTWWPLKHDSLNFRELKELKRQRESLSVSYRSSWWAPEMLLSGRDMPPSQREPCSKENHVTCWVEATLEMCVNEKRYKDEDSTQPQTLSPQQSTVVTHRCPTTCLMFLQHQSEHVPLHTNTWSHITERLLDSWSTRVPSATLWHLIYWETCWMCIGENNNKSQNSPIIEQTTRSKWEWLRMQLRTQLPGRVSQSVNDQRKRTVLDPGTESFSVPFQNNKNPSEVCLYNCLRLTTTIVLHQVDIT